MHLINPSLFILLNSHNKNIISLIVLREGKVSINKCSSAMATANRHWFLVSFVPTFWHIWSLSSLVSDVNPTSTFFSVPHKIYTLIAFHLPKGGISSVWPFMKVIIDVTTFCNTRPPNWFLILIVGLLHNQEESCLNKFRNFIDKFIRNIPLWMGCNLFLLC